MLLVAGDSFAQFPYFTWYGSSPTEDQVAEVTYPETSKGSGFTVDYSYPHWCQIIDPDAISVGYGGADIYTTTFVATQEIISNQDISHCIFFITGFDRDVVQTSERSIDKLNLDLLERPSIENFYNKKGKYAVDCHAHREHDEMSDYRLIGNYWFCQPEELRAPMEDSIIKYYARTPVFKSMHTKLACLSHLKSICDVNNVKILFVTPMDEPEWSKDLNNMLHINFYDFTPALDDYDNWIKTEQYKWLTSHVTKEHHAQIAQHFQSLNPNWLDK